MEEAGVNDEDAGEPERYLKSSGRGLLLYNVESDQLRKQVIALEKIERAYRENASKHQQEWAALEKEEKARREAKLQRAREKERLKVKRRSEGVKKGGRMRAMDVAMRKGEKIRIVREKEGGMPTHIREAEQVIGKLRKDVKEAARAKLRTMRIPLDGSDLPSATKTVESAVPKKKKVVQKKAANAGYEDWEKGLRRSLDTTHNVRQYQKVVVISEGKTQGAQSEEGPIQGKGKGVVQDKTPPKKAKKQIAPPARQPEEGTSSGPTRKW